MKSFIVRISIALSACLCLIPSGARSLDLPPPPAGYVWERCADIGGALLRPEGWAFRRVSQGDNLAYFITREPWEPPGSFDVGLTFNVVFDIPEKSGMAATEFARRFVSRAEETQRSERTWSREMGPFEAEGIVYSGVGENAGFKFFNLVIANDKTGTAYVAIFEAPESGWDAAWNQIEPTIQRLMIDDEY